MCLVSGLLILRDRDFKTRQSTCRVSLFRIQSRTRVLRRAMQVCCPWSEFVLECRSLVLFETVLVSYFSHDTPRGALIVHRELEVWRLRQLSSFATVRIHQLLLTALHFDHPTERPLVQVSYKGFQLEVPIGKVFFTPSKESDLPRSRKIASRMGLHSLVLVLQEDLKLALRLLQLCCECFNAHC